MLRVANCSGFYGDRVEAAQEMVSGGPIDVLTGDWLAELTMLILARRRESRGPGSGYAATFLEQLEQVLVPCMDRGIKVVSNAGGLDPHGLKEELMSLAKQLRVTPRIAVVAGDDLLLRIKDLQRSGENFPNLDTGEDFAALDPTVLTANAYLGAGGIAAALAGGADIVVTGRVTDASLVVGPAAWWFDWSSADADALAGATVAGHLIECGTQVTGGNYAFFAEVPGMEHLGFPIAEIEADGACVITKHPEQGGEVSAGTVTAQLLYEIDGPRYLGPDVVTRLDHVRVTDEGNDRVRVSGAIGEPAPSALKVALNYSAGFTNTVTFVLTGLDLEAKASLVELQLFAAITGGREAFDDVHVQLLPHRVSGEPENLWQAQAELRVTVTGNDRKAVDRAFTSQAVALTLASVPGLFLPGTPPKAEPLSSYWPTTVGRENVITEVEVYASDGGDAVRFEPRELTVSEVGSTADPLRSVAASDPTGLQTVRAPLGRLVGARSGDKGGNVNIGLWIRHDLPDRLVAYHWLLREISAERFTELLPEGRGLHLDRFEFDNLHAVNFVVRGLLGRGVSGTSFPDPQGKGLGEYVRARLIDLPLHLLEVK